eukprot:gnl/TRDRNA2_/TRDRNA2_48469_c0_seq1.p2 gnl/TRDRNA2_/TRDRNA2_48469_c0~~gnl/TRDRNA2_/TRDRNA2_48469_c0_seq1.p2  ORF type:complete len:307 (+),score=84.86 gnl/TRDRNA2_/TRDRNA2_48469_c0_seq1:40-960(+)
MDTEDAAGSSYQSLSADGEDSRLIRRRRALKMGVVFSIAAGIIALSAHGGRSAAFLSRAEVEPILSMELGLVPGAEDEAEPGDGGAKEKLKEQRKEQQQSDVDVKKSGATLGLTKGRLRFRAQPFFQEVLEDHILDGGLEIKMDMERGVNMARLPSGQTVDYSGIESNYPEVKDALRAAATWNDPARVQLLVGTCFYDSATMSPALLEAAAKGYTEVVAVLLNGKNGMSKASATALDSAEGTSALHRAMMNGHEEICKMMIDTLESAEVARPLNKQGLDPFEATRQEDLGGVARRMQKYLDEKFPK